MISQKRSTKRPPLLPKHSCQTSHCCTVPTLVECCTGVTYILIADPKHTSVQPGWWTGHSGEEESMHLQARRWGGDFPEVGWGDSLMSAASTFQVPFTLSHAAHHLCGAVLWVHSWRSDGSSRCSPGGAQDLPAAITLAASRRGRGAQGTVCACRTGKGRGPGNADGDTEVRGPRWHLPCSAVAQGLAEP